MGKFRKKIAPTAEGLQRAREQERLRAESKALCAEEDVSKHKDRRIAAIVFFAAAALLFAVSAAFTGITIARMRSYELDFVRMAGTVTDYQIKGGLGNKYLALVISYSYGGAEYSFADNVPFQGLLSEAMNTETEIYVNPKKPAEAVRVSSSGAFSIIPTVIFAISAFSFMIAVCLSGGGYRRRLLFGYLPVFAAGIVFMLLFWLGLPNDGFGAVFSRMGGATGYLSLSVLAAVAAAIDGAITLRFRKKRI